MAEPDPLRAAYASRPLTSGDHLSDQDWEQLACGELGSDARRRAHDHIVECRECTTIARAVMAIRSEAPSFDPGVPLSAGHRPGGNVTWLRRAGFPALLAAAAVVLLLVGVRAQLRSAPTGTAPGGNELVLRAARADRTPLPVAPVGAVAATPAGFEWQPVEGTASYVVEVLDDAGERLWTSAETTATTLPWPPAVTLGPGRHYWRVTAYRDGAGPPLESPLTAFDVAVTTSPR